MSAQITVRADNPAVEAALAMLIAQAIENAGFTNAKAKMISLVADIPLKRNGNSVIAGLPSGEFRRSPPELRPLEWIIPKGEEDMVVSIAERNPGMLDSPILLDFTAETSSDFEAQALYFLTTGKTAE